MNNIVAKTTTQNWMRKSPGNSNSSQSVINANQMTSLSAMIAYTAFRSGQSEFRIERRLADRFSIPNAKMLPAEHFDSAIRYLADALAA